MELEPGRFLQLLSDDTRLRCLALMHASGELCVCELVQALDESQPKISRHLATLRDAGIVSDRRQGQWVYYDLHAGLPDWARRILDAALTGTAAREPFCRDRSALATMPNRPGAARCA